MCNEKLEFHAEPHTHTHTHTHKVVLSRYVWTCRSQQPEAVHRLCALSRKVGLERREASGRVGGFVEKGVAERRGGERDDLRVCKVARLGTQAQLVGGRRAKDGRVVGGY